MPPRRQAGSSDGRRPLRRPAAKRAAKKKAPAKKRAAKKKAAGKKTTAKKRASGRRSHLAPPKTRRRSIGAAKRPPRPVIPQPVNSFGAVMLRAVIVLILGCLAGLTTVTFFQNISTIAGTSFWAAAPVYFFLLGVVVFPLLLWGFGEWMLYLYVFGHELTHVVFIYLCGGRVFGGMRVSTRGGHVVTNKTNWLISLSPYFVPFYALLAGTCFFLAGLFIDLSAVSPFSFGMTFQPLYLLYGLIGLTWAMHIYYTLTMILRDQPDLQMNGVILSLLVIYLINLCLIVGMVIAASPTMTLAGYWEDWTANARGVINLILLRIGKLIW